MCRKSNLILFLFKAATFLVSLIWLGAWSGAVMAAPAFQAAGTAVGATGAVSPAWPAHQIDDIALLFVESTGGQPATLSTPAGFVAGNRQSPEYGHRHEWNANYGVLGAGHFDDDGHTKSSGPRRSRLRSNPHLPGRHHYRQSVGHHRRRRQGGGQHFGHRHRCHDHRAGHAHRSGRRAGHRLGSGGSRRGDESEPDGHHRAIRRGNDLRAMAAVLRYGMASRRQRGRRATPPRALPIPSTRS